MTQEEYKNKVSELNERHEQELQLLRREYAFANNPYKIGDTVTDHAGSIKIEKIQYTTDFSTNLPCCVYTGVELKKDGTPTKRESKRKVHQSNIQITQ
jgi:hypothetical protein